MKRYESWGRYPRVRHAGAIPVFWRSDVPPLTTLPHSVLPFAMGRSYGDVCLNEDGLLLDASGLSRFMAFDEGQGVLCCEAGVTVAEILALVVPRGWFLPVTPGTQHVSLGGAIANDVHGKNHHRAGAFGCHVKQFELLRSSHERLSCSIEQHHDLFRATIGGLGLTGLITWAEIQLQPVRSPLMAVEKLPFSTLEEFFQLTADSDPHYHYTVAWIDCLVSTARVGRGVFMRANHMESTDVTLRPKRVRNAALPGDIPWRLLNRHGQTLMNRAYYAAHRRHTGTRPVRYETFFYPLDAIENWNSLYGRGGLLQYQCVIPLHETVPRLQAILTRVAQSDAPCFLGVLKVFGARRSPGLMSFPRPGVTLALDFPYEGDRTLRLLDELDGMVREYGGAVYPAKDARMSADSFQAFFPQWRTFAQFIDPKFSSSFWRRVTRNAGGPTPCSGS